MLDELQALHHGHPGWTSDAFPFVLSAGERRASTANTIIRDPDWRKRDRPLAATPWHKHVPARVEAID